MKTNSTNSAHKMGEVVLSAIKKLMKNTGWTSRTIIKFIKMEYGLGDPNISRKVSRALRRGVKLGLLTMDRGRYRLNDMSRLARQVSAREIRKRQKPRHNRSREKVPEVPNTSDEVSGEEFEVPFLRSRAPSHLYL